MYFYFGSLFLGLTLKCVTNGDLPDKGSKDSIHKERFAEKNVECESDTSHCATLTGPNFGSEPLLICGPPKEDDEKNGCKSKDDNEFCFCDTDLCNKGSSAGRFVSYWSLITFAVVISVY